VMKPRDPKKCCGTMLDYVLEVRDCNPMTIMQKLSLQDQ